MKNQFLLDMEFEAAIADLVDAAELFQAAREENKRVQEMTRSVRDLRARNAALLRRLSAAQESLDRIYALNRIEEPESGHSLTWNERQREKRERLAGTVA